MSDTEKTRGQLIQELERLRRRVTKLETAETRLTESENAMRESEERFRTVIENLPGGVFVHDLDGRILMVNDMACQNTGYSPEELQRMSIQDIDADVDPRDDCRRFWISLGKGERASLEAIHKRKDGTEYPAEVHLSSITLNGKPVILGTANDITDRKRAEEALRTSQAQLSNAMKIAHLGYWEYDADDDLFTFNDHFYDIFRTSAEKVGGYRMAPKDYAERFLHPDDTPLIAREMKIAFEATDPNFSRQLEHRIIYADGEVGCISVRFFIVKDKEGRTIKTYGANQDITERKRIEEDLRESEMKFRTYISSAPDGVFVIDELGRCIEVNEAACRMTGHSDEDLLNMPIELLAEPEHVAEWDNAFERLKNVGSVQTEVRWKCRDGLVMWVSVNAVSLAESRFIAFCSDITETKRLRELEIRAQRLETAGQIAGQVAHDFNNLLGPLIAYPDFIREELPANHAALEYLDSIETAASRIADINQQLLTLARRGHYTQKPLDLNEIVLTVINDIARKQKALVFETDLEADLRMIMGGDSQMHRIIMNLVNNASDAMRESGTITIKTENYIVDSDSASHDKIPDGGYVRLTVSDTGCGIPDDMMDKIFDPFFTSKRTDKKRGSGLGLSVVDAVVKDHEGYVDLASRVGHGTSFHLYFPFAESEVGQQDVEETTGGSETVLVVDDDDMQRTVSRNLLERLGYDVSCVESGEKAVEFLRETPKNLVILDMVMPPGMDGAETYRRILEIDPDQKAIIVSGYSETGRVSEAQKLGAGTFVKKPFTRETIAAAVRKELSGRDSTHA